MNDANSTIGRIIDGARVRLTGALDGNIRMELFSVAKDFFQRSNIWKEEIPFVVVPGIGCYELIGEEKGLINRLFWVEGARQTPTNSLPAPGPQKPAKLSRTGVLTAEVQIGANPAQNELWYAHVALTVADPTDRLGLPSMPGWIIEKYSLVFVDGLVARMAAYPGKPYSNKALAAYHGREFRAGTNLANNEATHGNVYGGQAWSFPQGFRTRTQKVW